MPHKSVCCASVDDESLISSESHESKSMMTDHSLSHSKSGGGGGAQEKYNQHHGQHACHHPHSLTPLNYMECFEFIFDYCTLLDDDYLGNMMAVVSNLKLASKEILDGKNIN